MEIVHHLTRIRSNSKSANVGAVDSAMDAARMKKRASENRNAEWIASGVTPNRRGSHSSNDTATIKPCSAGGRRLRTEVRLERCYDRVRCQSGMQAGTQ